MLLAVLFFFLFLFSFFSQNLLNYGTFWCVKCADTGWLFCTSNQPKILLIDGDSVSLDLYSLECCFQLGDLYVQNVVCVTRDSCQLRFDVKQFESKKKKKEKDPFLTRTCALSARNMKQKNNPPWQTLMFLQQHGCLLSLFLWILLIEDVIGFDLL